MYSLFRLSGQGEEVRSERGPPPVPCLFGRLSPRDAVEGDECGLGEGAGEE
jgi:hypothetical protein